MIHHRRAFFVAFALLVFGIAPLARARQDVDSDMTTRTCGTVETGPFVVAPDAGAIQKWIRENRIAAGGVIPVHFHIITSNSGEGNVSDSQIDAQIDVLNNNYAGKYYDGGPAPGVRTGFAFFKASVDRTANNGWYHMIPGSGPEAQAKNALAIDVAHSLNLYTCSPGERLLGWSVFPFSSIANTSLDGVVVHYGSLPGGFFTNYGLGGTATHEVGHWVGLYHTFQGGCNDDASCSTTGDLVCDTPAQATPTGGCPEGKDTCLLSAGVDPIHNYMDYSYDACYNQFTDGQAARLAYIMATYRPGISKPGLGAVQPLAARATGPSILVSPNPFNPTTMIDYSLVRDGQVSLRVYDVAGRAVATLVDGAQTAGTHRAVFEGRGLASGIYVALLQAEGQKLEQRLVMLK